MRVESNGDTYIDRDVHVGRDAYASVFIPTSDRNLKTNVTPVDVQQVLSGVLALPISTWDFMNSPGTRHLGPMAQDFHAAFGLGADDKHIATVDADGVALAAIQGLNEKVESGEQKAESRIGRLEAENAELKQEVAELRRLMTELSARVSGGAR
jgi:hypothetical protein